MSGNRPNSEGKVRGDNNNYNIQDGKQEFRDNYRGIFGNKTAFKPGRYYFIKELGYSVHEDEYNEKWHKKDEPKHGITIRVKGQPFEVVEVLKGKGGAPNIKKNMHSVYINI